MAVGYECTVVKKGLAFPFFQWLLAPVLLLALVLIRDQLPQHEPQKESIILRELLHSYVSYINGLSDAFTFLTVWAQISLVSTNLCTFQTGSKYFVFVFFVCCRCFVLFLNLPVCFFVPNTLQWTTDNLTDNKRLLNCDNRRIETHQWHFESL